MDLQKRSKQDDPAATPDAASSTEVNPSRARDHLANERTFLAWLRTGMSAVIFGFAIGRFGLALRQVEESEGHPFQGPGLSVWVGMLSIAAGVMMVGAGLLRYRKVRAHLDQGKFEPAGSVIDFLAILSAIFAVILAGYLVLVHKAIK